MELRTLAPGDSRCFLVKLKCPRLPPINHHATTTSDGENSYSAPDAFVYSSPHIYYSSIIIIALLLLTNSLSKDLNGLSGNHGDILNRRIVQEGVCLTTG